MALKRENDRLRKQMGELDVIDPAHAYWRILPAFEPLTWNFNVYLPACHEFTASNGPTQIGETFTSPGRFSATLQLAEMDGQYSLVLGSDIGILLDIELDDDVAKGIIHNEHQIQTPDRQLSAPGDGLIAIFGLDDARFKFVVAFRPEAPPAVLEPAAGRPTS